MDVTKDALDNRVLAALSYVFLLFLIPLGKKESAFCQFHARQGLLMFLVWIPVSLISLVPLVGWLAWLSMLVIAVMAIAKALAGESWEIPVIGKYAKKLNW